MNLTNDIESLYENIEISHHETIQGEYICPVCRGKYANEGTFTTHLLRRDCFDLKALIAGTTLETTTFEWYREVMEAHRNKSIHNVAAFRKDRLYRPFIHTMIYCIKNEESRMMMYLAYMMLVKKYKTINGALSNMQKDSNLRDYRLYLHANNEIDDELFVSQYGDDLRTDQHFLVRSLERAHLSVHTLLGWDLEEVLMDIPIDYKERIQAIAEAVSKG